MSQPAAFCRLDDYPLTRRALLWLLVAQCLAVAPFMLHTPAWIATSTLALLGLRVVLLHWEVPLPSRWLLVTLLGIASFGVLAQFGTLVGRDAGSALLLLLLGLKQFETRAIRDAVIGALLGFLVIAALFLFDQSIPIVVYALGTGVVLAAALSALNPGSGELRIAPNLKLAIRLLLQSLPVVFVLFVLFPRIEGPLWHTPVEEASGQTGLSDEMSPGRISRLIQSTRTAFRVSFDGPIPPESQRYWRGPVLWDFDGRTWRMPSSMIARRPGPVPENLQRPVDYTVTLEPHGRSWIFPLDLPALTPSNTRLTGDFQLRSREPIREVRQFRLRSYLDYTLGAKLSALERQLGLRLPPRYAPRTQQLGRAWRAELESDFAVVRRALDFYAQNPFFYTLNPPALQVDPVDEFLFETRRGFCEHYASSFVVLMRAAGIPARVVTGYQGGEYNPLGDYLLVRQADAHAWAEVWVQGRGWLRIDPTAAVSPNRIDVGIEAALSGLGELPVTLRSGFASEWLRSARLAWDSVNFYWNEWVLAFGPERQRRLMERLGWPDPNALTLVLTLIATILAISLGYAAFGLLRGRIIREEPIVREYRRFCARLGRVGLERRPDEGPLAFCRRIRLQRPDLASEVEPISKLYVEMRYAGAIPADLGRLRDLVACFHPSKAPKRKPAEAG